MFGVRVITRKFDARDGKFRSEVEAISGQRLRHLKPGPKPTKKRRIENDNIELLL
jgi:hypothetical protein